MASYNFQDICSTVHESRGSIDAQHGSILVFDPGHTTGWAFFHEKQLIISGQIATVDMEGAAVYNIKELIDTYTPQTIVLEDYRVYKWKVKQHAGSDMLTTRVIGCIETFASLSHIPVIKQPTQVAKNFCTDEKLKDWNMYKINEKHARDAIRHGCYFIIFGPAIKKGLALKNNPHKVTVG